MEKNIKARWKVICLAGIGIFLIPMLLNVLIFSWRLDTESPILEIFNTNGSIEGWLTFWGNLIGTVVSGCVAFIVAKLTISEQFKKEKRLETDLLIIKQLPALVRIRIELDTVLSEFLRIVKEKKETIDEYKENGVSFKERELIFSLDYSLLPLNEENFKNIDTILHVDLQADLIELQEFYNKFKSSLGFNFILSQQLVDEFMELDTENKLYRLLNSNQHIKVRYSREDVFELMNQVQINKDMRLKGWKKIEEEDYINTLSLMLTEVENRIELIRGKIEEKEFYE
ncbi:hypothetical protein [Paenibacillus sp. DR312]|uniref:hypothetical protein n=1 Tax=unclassified Paenibacillus TaxID=185978 RepID=UPI001C945217|nr:hypothetical protein [Paenibacillus sp. DR312]QZN76176.1 hypothetical protein K5K90_02385 [Paenibacillus sp. DR312]